MDSQIIGMFTCEKGLMDYMAANRVAFNSWANELLSRRELLEGNSKQKFDQSMIDGAVMSRHHYL